MKTSCLQKSSSTMVFSALGRHTTFLSFPIHNLESYPFFLFSFFSHSSFTEIKWQWLAPTTTFSLCLISATKFSSSFICTAVFNGLFREGTDNGHFVLFGLSLALRLAASIGNMLFFRQHFFVAGQQPNDTRQSCSSSRLTSSSVSSSASANTPGWDWQLGNCLPSFLSQHFTYPLLLDLSSREAKGEVWVHEDIKHTPRKEVWSAGVFFCKAG